jgi:hypothetical protein
MNALRVHFADDDDADDFVDLKIGQAIEKRRKPVAAAGDTVSVHEDDEDDRDEAIAVSIPYLFAVILLAGNITYVK